MSRIDNVILRQQTSRIRCILIHGLVIAMVMAHGFLRCTKSSVLVYTENFKPTRKTSKCQTLPVTAKARHLSGKRKLGLVEKKPSHVILCLLILRVTWADHGETLPTRKQRSVPECLADILWAF